MRTLDAGGARFEFVGIDSGVPVICDLDMPGHRSVTNAAEAVVPAVLAEVAEIAGNHPDVIVYRDSMGQFDGLLVGDGDSFAGFLPLGGARSLTDALARLPEALATRRTSDGGAVCSGHR